MFYEYLVLGTITSSIFKFFKLKEKMKMPQLTLGQFLALFLSYF